MAIETTAIPYAKIHPSRFQPEGARGSIDDLARDIAERGLLQKIRLRPHAEKAGHYEVVFGHRRLAALQKLKLDVTLGPDAWGRAQCEEAMADDRALEALIAENLHRVNPTPLQQADTCRHLLAQHDGNIEEAAARVGLSPTTVARRLRLLALPKAVRKALDEERLSLGAAELIGTLQSESAMQKAWKRGTQYAPKGTVDAHWVRHHVEGLRRKLSDAPFDRKDATLPGGPCAACPKRSAAQVLLFEEGTEKDDRCLDFACWDGKIKEVGATRLREAKAAGTAVLTDSAARDAVRDSRRWKLLSDRCVEDPKQRVYSRLLGKHCPPITLAVLEDRTVELVDAKQARAALALAGHSFKVAGTGGRTREAALNEGRKRRFDNAVQLEVRRRMVSQAAGVLPLKVSAGANVLLDAVIRQLSAGIFGARLEHCEALYGGKLVPKSTADRARCIVALLPAYATDAPALERALGVDRAKVRAACAAYLKAVVAAKEKRPARRMKAKGKK